MQITKNEFLKLLKPYSTSAAISIALENTNVDENFLAFMTKEAISKIWIEDIARDPKHHIIRYQLRHYNDTGYFNFKV